jgi:TolB protein
VGSFAKQKIPSRMLAVFLAFAIFFPVGSYGALNLELTKGVNAKIPLAVLPFAWQGNESSPPVNLAKIIRHDLALSGKFSLANVPNNSAANLPNTVGKVDFSYWRKQGLNNLVIGQLQSQGAGQYQLNYSLLNLFKNQQQITPTSSSDAAFNPQNNPVLATKTLTVQKSQLTMTAHQIANQIYQQLTGSPGFFTTKIAYVLATKKPDDTIQYALNITNFDGTDTKTLLSSAQPIMSPSWSPDHQKLAYVSFQTGYSAIYTYNLANGNRRLLASYSGINGAPAWSPDGKSLAVVLSKSGNANIYQLNLSNGRLTQLTTGFAGDTKPTWSPDGQSIAFTSNRSGTPQIYELNVASKKVTQITHQGIYNADPAFSPVGNSIAYIHKKNGNFDIVLRDLSSGQSQYLTDGQEANSPTFSPNGNLVLYSVLSNGISQLAFVSINKEIQESLPPQKGDMVEPSWS